MKTSIDNMNLFVQKEVGDKKFRHESAFWYALKLHLNSDGHDLIKKVMAKDGHMMGGDNHPYYLRDRKWRYCFYDPNYAIRLITEAWNAGDQIKLAKEVFICPPKG